MNNEIVNELFISNPNVLADLDFDYATYRPKYPENSDESTSDKNTAGIQLLPFFNITQTEKLQRVPNLWSWNFIGLYSQYAAIGLLYGTSGTLFPFCVYVFDGEANLCANASSMCFFAWNLKIFFAMFTDSHRPFGLRRKPWMIVGWMDCLCGWMIVGWTDCPLDGLSV
jgi:hypothetical protein